MRIYGTLKYGRLLSIWGIFAFSACSLGGIALAIYGGYALFLYELTGYFFMSVMGVAMSSVGVYFLIRDIVQRIKIKKWKTDSVKLSARFTYKNKAEQVWERDWGFYKLFLSFKYDGKLVKKESGTKPTNGYGNWFGFRAAEYDVLYSPQYDEVILLKTGK